MFFFSFFTIFFLFFMFFFRFFNGLDYVQLCSFRLKVYARNVNSAIDFSKMSFGILSVSTTSLYGKCPPDLQACQQMSICQWQIVTNYAISRKDRPLWQAVLCCRRTLLLIGWVADILCQIIDRNFTHCHWQFLQIWHAGTHTPYIALESFTLPKLLTILKNALDKSCSAFNYLQKSLWGHMSISPRSEARVLQRLQCLRSYNVLKWCLVV